MPQVLQQLCASGCDCPACRTSTWGGTEEHGAMAQRAYNHRSPFGVLQRRVQDPWTSFWYNPLPCVSSQSEHWKDGLIASSWWCYVFSMFFISSHKLFMSIRASNTQEQVEERQTWKLFIATTSNLKPCVKIDLPDSLPSPLVQIWGCSHESRGGQRRIPHGAWRIQVCPTPEDDGNEEKGQDRSAVLLFFSHLQSTSWFAQDSSQDTLGWLLAFCGSSSGSGIRPPLCTHGQSWKSPGEAWLQ